MATKVHYTWQKFETTLSVITTVRNLIEGHDKIFGFIEDHGKRSLHDKSRVERSRQGLEMPKKVMTR